MKYFFLSVFLISSSLLRAADSELAQELTNPIADLMTIPIQATYDRNIGPIDKGTKLQTNIQPVIPFELSQDYNLITRTILPVIKQKDIALIPGTPMGTGSQFGTGDTSLSLFVSPKKVYHGVMWGAGPIILLPTASNDYLGTKEWGIGPSAVVVAMLGPWTLGGLANHVWTGHNAQHEAVSNTFLQPFAAYTWPNAWTVSLQSESTYNWRRKEWAVPFTAAVAKLVRFGKLPVSLQAGVGYWTNSSSTSPEGARFRLQANFVLPKF